LLGFDISTDRGELKMRELSLHILDLVENSLTAGADRITVRVEESTATDRLSIWLHDNGKGMPEEKIRHIEDPFVTTRETRRVGLGLSLLAAAARRCDGDLSVTAQPGQGTTVRADFRRSHIDLAPMGDIAATIGMVLIANPDVDFTYTHRVDEKDLTLNTRELNSELEGRALSDPMVIHHLTVAIRQSLKNLTSGTTNGSSPREDTHGKTDL
jgi:anti-sigma regulatory factor (Ser/Thr protein kinase)